VWGNGKAEGVRQRAAREMMDTARAARKFFDAAPRDHRKQIKRVVVNGFTGSSIWHLLYSFPPVLPGDIDKGYADFAKRWIPILNAFEKHDVYFALEVHPTEIAFDIASTRRALQAIDHHPRFGFNFDPSHLGYQGVDYVRFIREFGSRIFHVHMKDVSWSETPTAAGVFGGHLNFGDPERYWDFRSLGRGRIDFEAIMRALNGVGYDGPLSVEWEDNGMDREAGATEAAAFVRRLDFASSGQAFDAVFARE
jgi:sugar phosphate isomerase/epimerase